MTPAGVMYVSMYDYCKSQVSLYMTPEGVKHEMMHDSSRSQVSPCMNPTGVNNLHDSCSIQVYQYV